jgi:hypothetical protein
VCRWRHACSRPGDRPRNRRTPREGRHPRARSTARKIRRLAGPSGSSPESLNPEACSSASANRSSAASFSTRRRSFRISCRSSGSVRVRQFQSDHDPGRRAEPSTRRRARDPEIGGDGQVPGASDEIPEPVVIALLRAGRGRHPDDGRPIADTAQLLQDDAGRHSPRRELARENKKCRWRQLRGRPR